ncbi:PAS domain-containing sensor histidine kinase [Saccharopolyspora rhizosphaerae]|uniref:histidine kinase n=1 Tax=Saccharopolyspora rhizosphaerae TaxID=2492662 RepID=A0A3R8VI24_9PSEU|nr:PAS domain-containing sensor histidine kinase [Saccharopolyspora rhizosphaerae]RRO17948.1 PAS domain-containing sensor histidine kinase [Saccharopolyspora rhizosphaerae]
MVVDPQAPELVDSDFVAMMHASHLCVLIHDAATKDILWANPAACSLLEWSVTELRPLKANHMSSSAQQYDRVIGRAWLQEAVEKGMSRIEWHYRSRSGRVIPTDAIAVRVELAQGPAVMVQFRDVEREQRVEHELRQTTSYVDALARHTSTVAFMLDSAGAIRFATDTALAHLGLSGDTEPPVGRLLESYARLRRDGTPITWAEAAEAADPVAPVRLEVPGTEPVTLEGGLERLRDVDAFLMILHDVSTRVRGEERRELELRHENYLARYTAMGDMAMAIAHELGQPLAAAANFLAGVRAHAQALESSGRVPAGTTGHLEYGLDSAHRQIDRVSAIVGALRSFVGHLEHVEQVVDLNAVIDECLYFVRLRAEAAGVEVDVWLSEEPVPVRCERVLTGQVVLNLCFNAIDEMAEAGSADPRIELVTEVRPEGGTVTVADRGRGVRKDLFAESFTSKEHGSGIGLALSYRIINRQHGSTWCEPREAGGSIFGFSLPLA